MLLVAFVAFPGSMAVGQGEGPDPTRDLPAVVERGEQFDVTITFHASADDFHAPCLIEWVPAGWSLSVSKDWCSPRPFGVKVTGNMIEYAWIGSWDPPTNFTVLYKVTVPCSVSLGKHPFDGDMWYFDVEHENQTLANVTGDFNVTVVRPAINFTPASINFYGAVNGTNPLDQTLELWSSTPCPLSWNVTDDADWLEVYPTNGSCTNVHNFTTLSVNSSGMDDGTYSANITIESPDANNTQEIVPVTLHMSVTDVLEAHVSFVGRGEAPDDRWIELFEVKLFAPGTTNVVWEGNRTTNNTGWFNLSDVVVGTYDIAIKNCTCLSELEPVTVSEGAGGVVDFGTTREGDVQESDKIDGFDVSALGMAYGTNPGDGNWDPNADLNRSGKVDGFDTSLLGMNYGERGDASGCF